MERKALKGGRLIEGGYDEAEKLLEIVFADLSVKQFKPVPREVWSRLLAAPNAGSYYEDRIQDEYPGSAAPKLTSRPKTSNSTGDPAAAAKAKLAALFGKSE
jgi:KTSC domain